ncbi:MAG: hypothetical protein ACKVWR_15470 [Acidimicrobiales bacterium]
MTADGSTQRSAAHKAAVVLGAGALVTGGLGVVLGLFVAVLLIGPLLFWLAWSRLGLADSMALPELGFWPIVLATLFLTVGWFGKTLITGIVFLVDPTWLHGSTASSVSWPAPTLRNFVAVALLAMLAARPHARAHGGASAASGRKSSPAKRTPVSVG